jgi:hypothetical protein
MPPVSQIAYVATGDYDTTRKPDTRDFDKIVNVCTDRATDALKVPAVGYTQLQCEQISDIFYSMSSTHRTIRRLLDVDKPIDPEAVDTLPLARLQLECLYAVCLMFEDPKYVTHYMQEDWKKRYVQYLLIKEETQNIPRAQQYFQSGELLRQMNELGDAFGITPAQRATIEFDELRIPLPIGIMPDRILNFPTPHKVIGRISSSPEKKRMLERLHAKYSELCSFAHGLRLANELKRLFDNRSIQRKMTADSKIKHRYEHDVVSEAYLTSFMSIAQCTAELTTLYQNNLDLFDAAVKAWTDLAVGSLLTKAVWEIRTRRLLGVIA